jgi:multidrug efflux pump
MFMRDALEEITKTLAETVLIVRLRRVPVHGSSARPSSRSCAMPVSLIGRRGHVRVRFSLNLLTILARSCWRSGWSSTTRSSSVETSSGHVREGGSGIDAAMLGARELLGPIVAMTITLAAVYAPIGFQGG